MPSSAFAHALKQLRSICLALPEATEVEAWGHPTFRAGKKMFAAFGEGVEGENGLSLGVKVGFDRQDELLQDPRFYPTPYAAHQGWVSLKIDDKTDWAEIRCLLHEAYRQVALKRMLKALDGRARLSRLLVAGQGFDCRRSVPGLGRPCAGSIVGA
jgi:predicted DNA-binding protein (MmcQ/YjbR family)